LDTEVFSTHKRRKYCVDVLILDILIKTKRFSLAGSVENSRDKVALPHTPKQFKTKEKRKEKENQKLKNGI